MLRWGDAWSTLGNCATLGTPGPRWGTVYAGGTPGPRWGTVLRWGDAWSTLGNCATLGDAWSTLGNCVTLGDAWSTLGNCVTLGGRLVHAGELCYAGGTPGPRWGNAWSSLFAFRMLVYPRTSQLVVCDRSEVCLEGPSLYSWIRAAFSSFLM